MITCTCEIGIDDTILNIDQYCPDHFDGDGAPLTRETVTAGAPPAPDTRDEHDRSL